MLMVEAFDAKYQQVNLLDGMVSNFCHALCLSILKQTVMVDGF